MTYEEAIITLKTESCTDCSYGCDSPINCISEGCEVKIATEIAIEAIEKQIQKKPLIDPKWIFSLQCPCCRAEIADTEHRWEKRREHLKATMFFCAYCGQALDWSDEE